MPNSEIIIYSDSGVSDVSLNQTIMMLRRHVDDGRYKIRTVDSLYLRHYFWEERTSLLIFPGGADVFYQKALCGVGNARIKDFIINGGSYLGICAGAYYASSRVEFALGQDIEVNQPRDLNFFQGTATGPVLSNYVYGSEVGARAGEVMFCDVFPNMICKTVFAYYNGGCTFIRDENIQGNNLCVIANYVINGDCSLPAIVGGNVGKGKALLSGVHFEYEMLKENAQNIKEINAKILSCMDEKLMLEKNVLTFLGV